MPVQQQRSGGREYVLPLMRPSLSALAG
jgi:hypothetical protein